MNGTESSPLGIAIASLILFGCIHLVQRAGRPQHQAGSPSVLLRACGLLAGFAGAILVLLQYFGNPYFALVMPYCVLFVVMLLGYGFFGLPRPGMSGPAAPPLREPGSWDDAVPAPGTWRQVKVKWRTLLGYSIPAVLLAGVLIAYMGYASLPPQGLTAQAAHPDRAGVGEPFQVTVDLANPGEREIMVQEICLAPAAEGKAAPLLADARMTHIHPILESHDIGCSSCTRVSDFTVKAGETEHLTFYFEGLRPGQLSTDIFFYANNTATAVANFAVALTPRSVEEQDPQASCEVYAIAGASPPNLR